MTGTTQSWGRLFRSELRKLTSTKLPWVFLGVLAAISGLTATAVVIGTDMDGSKAFISTAADQRSLMAFAANAFMGAGLFGAIAVAREYGHHTVVPTFLASPRRSRAVGAQLAAVAVGGGMLSLVGAAMTVVAVAASLTTTEYTFLVSIAGVARVIAAATLAGAAGAILGAGIGAVVRNTGGAVTSAVLVLVIVPPLIVQLANETASWVPNTLANVLSGVGTEVGPVSALAAIAAWGIVPALIGWLTIERRDVV